MHCRWSPRASFEKDPNKSVIYRAIDVDMDIHREEVQQSIDTVVDIYRKGIEA